MKNFKNIITVLFTIAALASGIAACDTDAEALEIQKPYTYSELYYQNLRDYKASDHQVSFMWFADYSSSHSYGLHFLGLPDSLDICSLWGGIPSDVEGKPHTFYNPKVHEEMRFCQEVKGVKLTYVVIPNTNGDWAKDFMALPEEERVPALGQHFLNIIYDNDLDGIDFDYEIDGCWLHGDNFVELVKYMGDFIGPKGKDTSKLLIVDGWPVNRDPKVYDYVSYFIAQAYSCSGASDLQSRFGQVWHSGEGLPPEKYIVTENIGDYYATGGTPFTEVDGNKFTETGEPLYSLEGMARWNPTQGKKGGFGAFFGQRDYGNTPPYKHFRKGIQIQNPAVKN